MSATHGNNINDVVTAENFPVLFYVYRFHFWFIYPAGTLTYMSFFYKLSDQKSNSLLFCDVATSVNYFSDWKNAAWPHKIDPWSVTHMTAVTSSRVRDTLGFLLTHINTHLVSSSILLSASTYPSLPANISCEAPADQYHEFIPGDTVSSEEKASSTCQCCGSVTYW